MITIDQAIADANYKKILESGGDLFKQSMFEPLRAIVESNDSKKVKYIRLHKVVNDAATHIYPHSACTKGCSYCCHISVSVTPYEAALIGQVIHTPPIPIKYSNPFRVSKFAGVPCPFLKDNSCSIYNIRPIVCRAHFNISDQPKACDSTAPDSKDNTVHSLDFNNLYLAIQMVFDPDHNATADIREFFPKGKA